MLVLRKGPRQAPDGQLRQMRRGHAWTVPVVKTAAITKLAAVADVAAMCAERFLRGGRVRVLSIQCLECGRWVKPDYWNPATAVCEMCTLRMVGEGRSVSIPLHALGIQ